MTYGKEYYSELQLKSFNWVHIHHIWPKNGFDATSPISPHIFENLIILDQKQHLGGTYEWSHRIKKIISEKD